MVEGADIITIILSIITLLLLAGGIVLLVLSIRSTVRKKKRIGGIIGANIMIVFSFITGAFALLFLFLAAVSNSVYNDRKIQTAGLTIQQAIENKDPEYFSGTFASKGYSGRKLEYEDAMVLINNIEGDVENIKFTVTAIDFKGSTRYVKMKFVIKTSAGQYTLYDDYITDCSKESYLGTQHVRLEDKSGKLCDYGRTPDL